MYDDMGRENWTELWSTSSLKDRQGHDIGKDDKARQEVKKNPGEVKMSFHTKVLDVR